MKAPTKFVLALAVFGALGVGAFAKTVYAVASENRPAVAEIDDAAEEQQEAAQLQPLAKISAREAQQAAEKAVGDRATRTKLENEDGNLVYTVEIARKEVIVDAGNGQVLQIEAANTEENEAAEASHPRSSIQVPENRDRETDSSR